MTTRTRRRRILIAVVLGAASLVVPMTGATPPAAAAATVVQVDGGDGFTLLLKSDGTVWAWGENYAGQLGNGGTLDS
ncbi:MAG TPA: RCC1 domain-containing protein, partial [Acidimicrobiales bacterium]